MIPCDETELVARLGQVSNPTPKDPKETIYTYIKLLKEFVEPRADPGKWKIPILNQAKFRFNFISTTLGFDWTPAQKIE